MLKDFLIPMIQNSHVILPSEVNLEKRKDAMDQEEFFLVKGNHSLRLSYAMRDDELTSFLGAEWILSVFRLHFQHFITQGNYDPYYFMGLDGG